MRVQAQPPTPPPTVADDARQVAYWTRRAESAARAAMSRLDEARTARRPSASRCLDEAISRLHALLRRLEALRERHAQAVAQGDEAQRRRLFEAMRLASLDLGRLEWHAHRCTDSVPRGAGPTRVEVVVDGYAPNAAAGEDTDRFGASESPDDRF